MKCKKCGGIYEKFQMATYREGFEECLACWREEMGY
jgi:hypothetical protein